MVHGLYAGEQEDEAAITAFVSDSSEIISLHPDEAQRADPSRKRHWSWTSKMNGHSVDR